MSKVVTVSGFVKAVKTERALHAIEAVYAWPRNLGEKEANYNQL